jgi:8-oxo-dGTP pyrophosphatase MutT (NUDIX family)
MRSGAEFPFGLEGHVGVEVEPDAEIEAEAIPEERLPPGFLDTLLDGVITPAVPRPAATAALLRDGPDGPEVLLLKRARSTGFIPGAWVFPGGRVDEEDGDPSLVARVRGLTPEVAAQRLGLDGVHDGPPAIAFYLAAIRETFEETGLWPGEADLPTGGAPRVLEVRDALLAGSCSFEEALDALAWTLPGGALDYVGHWTTPVVEPRRYTTRFFGSMVRGETEPTVDERETAEALWLTPLRALEANLQGRLPMVFPTLHTLRELAKGGSAAEVLERMRHREVVSIVPRLVRTPEGVALRVPRRVLGRE